jgi:hypothetical protein
VKEPDHIKSIMSKLATDNDLTMGKDIKLIGSGHPENYRSYIRQNQNST